MLKCALQTLPYILILVKVEFIIYDCKQYNVTKTHLIYDYEYRVLFINEFAWMLRHGWRTIRFLRNLATGQLPPSILTLSVTLTKNIRHVIWNVYYRLRAVFFLQMLLQICFQVFAIKISLVLIFICKLFIHMYN